jgi:dCTP diphosphatase
MLDSGRAIVRRMADLDELRRQFREFVDERDWRQFHDPKSLILALVGEVGELAELFQWLPATTAAEQAVREPLRTRVQDELGDVLIYLLGVAESLDVDLVSAALAKLGKARDKFPVDVFVGSAPEKP